MSSTLNFWQRTLIRAFGLLLAVLALRLIIFRVFPFFKDATNHRFIIPIALTYIVATYVLLPMLVRFFNFATRRKRVPRYTCCVDGLPADPANIVIVGSQKQMRKAFKAIGWYEVDGLNIKNSWKMTKSFLTNKPYPTAPFSNLYLFGRAQDHGF